MSQATTCTPGHGTARGAASSHGKVVIPAPSATVTWRHQRGDRIFAMRETVDEQLKRVRDTQRERGESGCWKTMRASQRVRMLSTAAPLAPFNRWGSMRASCCLLALNICNMRRKIDYTGLGGFGSKPVPAGYCMISIRFLLEPCLVLL